MPTVPHSNDGSPPSKQTPQPSWALRIVIAIAAVIVAVSLTLLGLGKAMETANRAKCRSNLNAIGMVLRIYTQDHAGQYPDSFGTLLQEYQLTPDVFICPSSSDEAAEGDSLAAKALNMTAQPHHLSYIYLGCGLTIATVKGNTILAYELPENHQGGGMNVLFGDGHVEWEPTAVASSLIARAKAATRPLAPAGLGTPAS